MNALRNLWWELTVCGWRYTAIHVRERWLIRLAFWLPRSVVYWAFIRFVNAATECGSPDISCVDAMKRNADWYDWKRG